MAKILLKNGKIFDGERFLSGSVLAEDEKILAIGEFDAETDAQTLVIDAKDCIVCPGLVDVHTHLSELSGEPFGFPGALATIPFGVTAAVDASASPKNAARIEELPCKAAALLSLPLSEGRTDFDALDRGFAAYGDLAIGVKIYYDVAQSELCTLSQIQEASAFAHEKGGIVMVHCAGSPATMREVVAALGKGDILTHAYHGAPNSMMDADFAAYHLAKEKGVWIDAGMAGGVHTNYEVLKAAFERGYFPDVISTDITQFSAYKRGGIYGLPMCMSLCRAHGMDEADIFRAVTFSAAKAVLRGDAWGRLTIGGNADIAVLSYGKQSIDITDRAGNRVVLDEGYSCHMTVANGKILYRNGI